MADVEIPDLPAAVVVNPSDLLHIRQGAEDKKATVQLFSDGLDLVYLRQDDNLGSIDNSVTARANLDVQSTGEASATFLEEVNNLSDLTNVPAARNNLGLGTAATEDIGTGVGEIPIYAASQTLTGNVTGTSDSWDSSITLTLIGEATGFQSFDGTGSVNLTVTVVDDGHNHTLSTITDSGTLAGQDEGTGGGDFRDNTANDARFLLEGNNLSDVVNSATAFNNIKVLATTSASGVVEQATTAEAEAGTSAGKFPDVVGVAAAIQAQSRVPQLIWSGAGQSTVTDAEIFNDTSFVVVPGVYTLTSIDPFTPGDSSVFVRDISIATGGTAILGFLVTNTYVGVAKRQGALNNFIFQQAIGGSSLVGADVLAIYFSPL